MDDKTKTIEEAVPKWRGRPIRPGWWVLDFHCDPGFRYWTGKVWQIAGHETSAWKYRHYPVLRRARTRDVPAYLRQDPAK